MCPVVVPVVDDVVLFFVGIRGGEVVPVADVRPVGTPVVASEGPSGIGAPTMVMPTPTDVAGTAPGLTPRLVPDVRKSTGKLLGIIYGVDPSTTDTVPREETMVTYNEQSSRAVGLRLTFSASLPMEVYRATSTKVFARPGGELTPIGTEVEEDDVVPCFIPLLFVSAI